ncbi:flagellar protein FlaG [Lysinibacillus sp. BPa_S21]|uniref:flagellar protein FlaG n=1 Tax=Lysinibacillus sp. BPa_S21 TaxID=2932478 RepID=UPI0020112D9A|nr:flagellar protein FlaG [Lysinibacillus sp. BPa_S21]MCL1695815.1 flagellar protein FlaG [Lysinibacillus sp. BPa_S21]
MRVASQNTEMSVQQNVGNNIATTEKKNSDTLTQVAIKEEKVLAKNKTQIGFETSEVPIDELKQAVNSVNEFLEVDHKRSKFVLHEGLDKYFIRLVDSETDEVIKEIPPEKILDAFYEMQKLVGMIVDEKI